MRIYDYVDHHVPMLDRMFRKRHAGAAIGYELVEDAVAKPAAPPVESENADPDADEPFEDDLVIEWDLDALRALEWDE